MSSVSSGNINQDPTQNSIHKSIPCVDSPAQTGSFMSTPGDLRHSQRDPNSIYVGGASQSVADPSRQASGQTKIHKGKEGK